MRELATYRLSERTKASMLNIAVVLSLLFGFIYFHKPAQVVTEDPAVLNYEVTRLSTLAQPNVVPFEELNVVEEPSVSSYSRSVSNFSNSSQIGRVSGGSTIEPSSVQVQKNPIVKLPQTINPILKLVDSVKIL